MFERPRLLLANALSFRWASFRGHALAPLIAIGAVLWQWQDAFATPEAGVPLWVWALGLAVTSVLGRELAGWATRSAGDRADASLTATMRGSLADMAGHRLEFGLLVGVFALWVALDASYLSRATHLYDMNVYLGSAARWLSGGSPYLAAPLTQLPAHAADDYFLYPPPLLPVFALLSKLPPAMVAVAWVSVLTGSALAAFRIMGLSWAWSLSLLLFPPLVKGVESGNVVNLTFLLFVAGAYGGETLLVNGLFKAQSGLPALWLVRERRWRAIASGAAVLVALAIVTLPFVGLGAWPAWFDSLGYRATSQTQVPILFGVSLAHNLPGWAFVAVSIAAVGAALLLLRGRRSLAGLGLASIVASPSLWLHGFVFAIPAVLDLESGTMVWAVLGVAGFSYGAWWMVIVGALALLLAKGPALHDALHPLAGRAGLGSSSLAHDLGV
jgi:hypothetical protein